MSTALADLRDVLAEFYPDEVSMRRVAYDAGLDVKRITINSNSSAVNNWHAILKVAEHKDKVDKLLEVVLNEYSENVELRQAINAYRASAKQKKIVIPPAPPGSRINLGILFIAVLLVLAISTRSYWQPFFVIVPTATPTAPEMLMTPSPTPQAGATSTNPQDNAVYVWIPGGEFMMGSSITETLANKDEQPQHKVVLDGFLIMRTEVTNLQYKRCVADSVCTQPSSDYWNDDKYAAHPVTGVDWNQAKTYAKWAGGRLPTEAEWEYACRGPDGRVYPWGNQRPDSQRLNEVKSSGSLVIQPVGSYPPGANELVDMAGNAAEWTADWYDETYYSNSPASKPQGPMTGTERTFRGGAFYLDPRSGRCAARYKTGESDSIGFRVVSNGF